MTLPYERTRAVVQAGEFLLELSRDNAIPEPVRMKATQLLRHYTARSGLLLAGLRSGLSAYDPKRTIHHR